MRSSTLIVASAAGLAASLALGGCTPRSSRAVTFQASGPSSTSFQSTTPEQTGGLTAALTSPLFGLDTYSRPVSALSVGEVARELEAMAAFERTVASFERDGSGVASAEVRSIDREHADRLNAIVDAIGWPTSDVVGERGASGALAVIQHAGHDTGFQEECLWLMRDLVAEGRLDAAHVALLTDRVRMFRGEPQVFGTQMTFEIDDRGVARAVPAVEIENPAQLDARRASVGLPPHAHFVRVIENTYAQQAGAASGFVGADAWTE